MNAPDKSRPAATLASIEHWIDGKLVPARAAGAPTSSTPPPASVSGRVALANSGEVAQAVAAAQAAFPAWADTPPIRRARVMFKFLELLNRHARRAGRAITAEHGKVFTDAQGEVTRGIDIVEFACGIPQLLKGDYTDQVATGIDNWTMRQPLGVVAGITPFNFPVMVPMWMYPVAIACGNTFILKPSRARPDAVAAHGRAAQGSRPARRRVQRRAGRQGGGRRAARAPRREGDLLRRLDADRQKIYETGARHGKRVQALGGAKNHMVVMPDADMDQAVDALIGAAYGSAGERCMAISVAVLVGDAADKIVPSWPSARGAEDQERHGPRGRDGAAGHRARTAQVRRLHRPGREEGAKLVVDGRGFKAWPGTRTASSSAARCSTTSRPT